MKIKQGVIRIDSIEEFLKDVGDCIVAIDAKYVIDVGTVKFAVEKALKSWKEGRNVAKNLPLEILLYFSATRQIRDAVKVGIKEDTNEVVLVLLDDCESKLKKYDFKEKDVVRIDKDRIENVKRLYGISDEEFEIVGVEKLPILIRERIALFDIFKT